MKLKRSIAIGLALLLPLLGGCESNEQTDGGGNNGGGGANYGDRYVVFTQSDVTYHGDEGYSETSDFWEITLYTADVTFVNGKPVGEGKMMNLSFNANLNPAAEPVLSNITGHYESAASTSDLSVGSYIWGDMWRTSAPGGYIYVPRDSYYSELAAGETMIYGEADLLRDGYFDIRDNGDGTFTIDGIIVGTYYLKRYFTFTGVLEPHLPVDNQIPNSTLTQDKTLEGLVLARLQDRGDSYKIGDFADKYKDTYRHFELYLAEPTVTLYETNWPTGKGGLLKADLFVPFESDVNEGIPAGEYTVEKRTGGGIEPSKIVPFKAFEGREDYFVEYQGLWYIELDGDNAWSEYARITDGTITVERPDGGHRITFDLTDCNGNKVSYVWTSDQPIRTYKE